MVGGITGTLGRGTSVPMGAETGVATGRTLAAGVMAGWAVEAAGAAVVDAGAVLRGTSGCAGAGAGIVWTIGTAVGSAFWAVGLEGPAGATIGAAGDDGPPWGAWAAATPARSASPSAISTSL